VTTSKEKFESKKLPMMPIRDVVIFPYMMTPFWWGANPACALSKSTGRGQENLPATQARCFHRRTQSPNEIYQVGTIVNIVQS